MGGIVTDIALCIFEASADLHIRLSRLLEAISSLFYHLGSRLLGAKPRANTSPTESALLVIGAEDGIGRSMALKFAQQGYTVFACVPNDNTRISQAEESSVSSLVYSWQKRSHKQNRPGNGSSESGGGSIIPLSFDYSRLEDRHRALETVVAYCARHSLQFSALILSPRRVFHNHDAVPSGGAYPERNNAMEDRHIVPALLSQINGSAWSDLIRREVTEPVLVVQDFVGLLASSGGKIVILSGCSEAWAEVMQGPTVPSDVAREAIARQFGRELSPRGVSVSLVIAGPLAESRTRWRKSSPRSIETSTHLRPMLYAIDEDTVFSIVSRAISSSYPKPTYYAGISVRIHRWTQLIPDTVWCLALLAWNNSWRK